MPETYQEKQLLFTFPDDLNWIELDKQGVVLPVGMALVDLVIERAKDFLLIEIKDPSHTQSPDRERKKYLKRLRNDTVLKQELVPKVRDTYTYQHLMEKDTKPFIYIVLLGLDAFDAEIQRGVLHNFSDRLHANLRRESSTPWVRNHISKSIVMSVDLWNKQFVDWPVARVSA